MYSGTDNTVGSLKLVNWEGSIDSHLCRVSIDCMFLLLSVEGLLSLKELRLDLTDQLLLQGLDGVLERGYLPISVLYAQAVLLELLLVGGQLDPFGLQLVTVVF